MLIKPRKRQILSKFKLPTVVLIATWLVLLVGACGGSDSVNTDIAIDRQVQPTVAASSRTSQISQLENRNVGGRVGDFAPEFNGIDAWINAGPLKLNDLRGQVVLIDFWTYTCINCIRTFPFLKQLHSRYADDGLVIVGIHTPEFEFEKVYENVIEATQTNKLSWTIAQDNKFVTWRSYNNRFWPAKYLIDKDGIVRYTHFGEGGYAETESKIRELLAESNPDFKENSLPIPDEQTIDPDFLNSRDGEITRELYGGYSRGEIDRVYGHGGYVQQMEYFDYKNRVGEFVIKEELEPHKLNFQGQWFVGPESLTHGRTTESFEDYLTLVYSATSVNAVLTSGSGKPYKVQVTVEDEYLTEDNKGSDIFIGDDGESYLLVTTPTIYNVISNESYVQQKTLKMSSNSPDFGLFSFTFGVYETGP